MPAPAAELAAELHASDLAELIVDLEDQQAGLMLAALPVPQAAATLDVRGHGRRQQIFPLFDKAPAAPIADAMCADGRAGLVKAPPADPRHTLLAGLPDD